MSSNGLITRRISLRPVQESDMQFLLMCRNDPVYMATCTVRRNTASIEEFIEEYRRDVATQRYFMPMLIVRTGSGEPVGFIYAHGFNKVDGFGFVNTFLIDSHRRQGYGAIALLLFIRHWFKSSPTLYKIYLDAYEYAASVSPMTAGIERFGFVLEGRFSGHRLQNDKRWDMLRFAVYSQSLPVIETFLDKLS